MSASERQGDASELFDASRYPNLHKVVYTDRGRMELISVAETSDGFLIGEALIGEGDDQCMHSVFLGTVDAFKAPWLIGEGSGR